MELIARRFAAQVSRRNDVALGKRSVTRQNPAPRDFDCESGMIDRSPDRRRIQMVAHAGRKVAPVERGMTAAGKHWSRSSAYSHRQGLVLKSGDNFTLDDGRPLKDGGGTEAGVIVAMAQNGWVSRRSRR